jgi:CubicO group peptidase (beta-lactamase class C family)
LLVSHDFADSIRGSLDSLKPFGKVSLEDEASLVSAASTIGLASATKLVTCVAAMQRGLVNLVDDIYTLLPEWKDAERLCRRSKAYPREGAESHYLEVRFLIIPQLCNRGSALSRQLLSHTSGITGLGNPAIMNYHKALGSDRATLIQCYFMSDDEEVRNGALEEIGIGIGLL